MDLSSSNKACFHFVCTNYGSNKDGIGHYTAKIVNELRKNSALEVHTYSAKTHHLSKMQLFFSMRISFELLRLKKKLKAKHNSLSNRNYIILEYPFVEYNPLFLLILLSIKAQKNAHDKIVISLHEFSRTKLFRKLFIKLLIPIGDVVLYTKEEDVASFINKNLVFDKRIIPANIEPLQRKKTVPTPLLHICFFGIINFETKEIDNMLKGWEEYYNKTPKKRIVFHVISSSFNAEIKNNNYINYHFDLDDVEVSKLLHTMHLIILPLKPKVSINNGSLAVCCIHECLPVGVFDDEFFDEKFGLWMKNYSVEEFVKVYDAINILDVNTLMEGSKLAYAHGKRMSIVNSAQTYLELINV